MLGQHAALARRSQGAERQLIQEGQITRSIAVGRRCVSHLDVLLALLLREELAPIRGQLAVTEQKLGLLPVRCACTTRPPAQEFVQALRKMAAKSPQPHESLVVPPGHASRRRLP
jgi:hypothetical protein